jgi:hypothetical protein
MVTMALNVSYPGKFSKIILIAIGICVLMSGTPVAALYLSNSNSGHYHGISYGYSVNLQSASAYPVAGTSESQGVSVLLFSPVLAGPKYQGTYLPSNPGTTQSLFKKLKSEYFVNPQQSIPVPPEYIQPFPSSESIHIATTIDYVDVTNQRIHTAS